MEEDGGSVLPKKQFEVNLRKRMDGRTHTHTYTGRHQCAELRATANRNKCDILSGAASRKAKPGKTIACISAINMICGNFTTAAHTQRQAVTQTANAQQQMQNSEIF